MTSAPGAGTEVAGHTPRWTRAAVAALVDHTLLKPEATTDDVLALVDEASRLGVHAVCVSPSMVATAAPRCPAGLVVAAVAGFPSGKHSSAVKAHEAELAAAAGATEIDMVIDIGAALAGRFAAVRSDIAVVRAAVPDAVLKVIVESAALMSLGRAAPPWCRSAARPLMPAPTSSRRRRGFTQRAAQRCPRCR